MYHFISNSEKTTCMQCPNSAVSQEWTYSLGKGLGDCLEPPKGKGPLKCFSYTRCALSADTRTFITTTTICVSELNMLLVYPACSKLKYYASETDVLTSLSSLFPRAHTPLSLSLSLSAVALLSTRTPLYISGWKELRFQLKHRYVSSLILHASIAEIIAQLLSWSYV